MAETVGEQLKKAREERKLTLEQVFQATRINPRYLQTLEGDDHDGGPSPVQVKGFLRLYADFLGLPIQPLLDSWDGKAPADLPVEPAIEMVGEQSVVSESGEITHPAVVNAGDEEDGEEAVPIEIQYVSAEEPEPPAPIEPEPAPSGSQLIFIEIGQMLRERREMLGLTLADVERFTKLRQHYLQALESGQMRGLPSLVQGRGMLSNYAGFLELDADAILLKFAEALQQRRIENMPPPPPPNLLTRAKGSRPSHAAKAASKNGWRRLVTPDILIGGVILIALVGFAIWGAAQVNALRGQAASEANATNLPIANILMETGTPTPPPATTTPTLPVAPAPLDAAEKAAAAQEGDTTTGEEVTPTGLPVIGDAPFQVYVIARQRAWLRVVVDGKTAFNGRVVPGNPYPFAGEKSIELTSGNAAALQIYYNQQDLGSLGVNGQTVSLIFDETGVTKPTPAFTATASQTPKPSVTVQPSPTLASPTVTPYIP